MHKNYNKFNLLSLLTILVGVILLVFLFDDSESEIKFADPGLEAAVRETIGKEEGTLIQKDIDTLQVLDASNRNIESLEGIEHLIELRELNLENNFVKSVTPLKANTKLDDLNLRNNEITSLEEINFQDIIYLNIRKLSLRHNVKRDEEGEGTRLSDISLLRQMASLRKLNLRDNHIDDLSPLSDLRRLTELDIRENKFETIEPLAVLNRLQELNLRENRIKSLEPIKYLSRLTYLNIHSNTEIESLDPIENLVNLETLIVRNIEVEDPSFLRNLTKLQRFNAIDTGIENLDSGIIEELRKKNALQGEVRPVRMLHTLDAPKFSQESGFYREGFALEIENINANTKVYYTLDGTEPTMASEIYTEPIQIQSMDDNSATVVRAKVLKEDNLLSETVTKTYFVNEVINDRFNLPIFSLVTDPDNLFDEEIGIYENYNNRGREWERPVYIEYLEKDGNVAISQSAGIRIHGGMTRGAPQKSLRIYAESEYDTDELFTYPFFENNQKEKNNQKFKRLLLRNSGNDWSQTMFNDALMQSLIKPLETIDVQDYQPSIVFINGEYWGIYNIRERQDEYHFQYHYDIKKEELTLLENNAELYRGGNKDVYHYKGMINFIEENGVIDNENLRHVETLMDFENYIDYFAAEIYFANADWPGNNIKFWRKTTDSYEEDAMYGHDGRWRWMLYDTDFGFYRSDEPWGYQKQPINHKHNTIHWVMTELDGVRGNRMWPNFLFRELMQNKEFNNNFLVRFNDLVNSYLSPEVAEAKIKQLKNGINNEMPYHIDRWGAIESYEQWEEYIDKKYLFAKERPNYIRQYIMDEFDLDGTVEIVLSNETDQGYVRLNRMEITEELPGNPGGSEWSGTYFKGIPIKVEAIPKEGYKFSHWENINSSDSIFEFTPESDQTLKAVFVKK